MRKGITVLTLGLIIGIILIIVFIVAVYYAYSNDTSPLHKILGGLSNMISKWMGFRGGSSGGGGASGGF